jgi:PIN domain nuclease of toxin-antitoxin system
MNNKYVADTMAIILYLEKRKLPQPVKEIFSSFEKGNNELIIPAITAAEIGYLSERKRIDTNLSELTALISRYKNVSLSPLVLEIISIAFHIQNIPELHDRLITATAKFHQAALITNDPVISDSKVVETIW